MVAKRLTLQKLQHRRSKRLRHTINFIKKQNALRQPRLLHLLIDGRHNFTHRIFRDGKLLPMILFLGNERKPNRALPGMVRNGIGLQPNPALFRNLLHNLRLADARRTQQQDRTLTDWGNLIHPISILPQISLNGILNFLLRPFNVHEPTSKSVSPSISFIAQGGTSASW